MDNAARALVIAGGIMVSILIMSLAVYLFMDLGSTAAKASKQNEQQQLIEFNAKFTSFEGLEETSIYDIITLAGYAKENNDYYNDNDEQKIYVFIGNDNVTNADKVSLINKYVSNNGTLDRFTCKEITYNDNGRVNTIKFKKM